MKDTSHMLVHFFFFAYELVLYALLACCWRLCLSYWCTDEPFLILEAWSRRPGVYSPKILLFHLHARISTGMRSLSFPSPSSSVSTAGERKLCSG
jgi:hypothetical protein